VCPAHSLPLLGVEWVKESATPKRQEAFLLTPAFYRNFRPTLGRFPQIDGRGEKLSFDNAFWRKLSDGTHRLKKGSSLKERDGHMFCRKSGAAKTSHPYTTAKGNDAFVSHPLIAAKPDSPLSAAYSSVVIFAGLNSPLASQEGFRLSLSPIPGQQRFATL
jgi:hypothetical protein